MKKNWKKRLCRGLKCNIYFNLLMLVVLLPNLLPLSATAASIPTTENISVIADVNGSSFCNWPHHFRSSATKDQALITRKGVYSSLGTNSFGLADKYRYVSNSSFLERTNASTVENSEQTDIVFLGDSITEGCDFNELFGITYSVNHGISGDTTEGVLNRLDGIVGLRPKQIFIMIGINDIGLNIPQDTIALNYANILRTFRDRLADTDIFVLSVLPVSSGHPNPARNPARIGAMNTIIGELAQANGYEYIDLYKSMSDNDGNLRQELTTDGVHLSVEGYFAVRDVLVEYIQKH